MSQCGERAILIVTGHVEGTATHIARRRVALQCGLAAGHAGAHQDPTEAETWESTAGQVATLLRHEAE